MPVSMFWADLLAKRAQWGLHVGAPLTVASAPRWARLRRDVAASPPKTNSAISARKHWERGWSVHDEVYFDEIKTPAKNGRGWTYVKPPSHPRKGTIMVGAMEGYYEPEWSEQTAYEALCDIVFMEFTDWREESQDLTRPLNNPSLIFAAAAGLIANRTANAAERGL